ncbi:hypothetical protein ACFL1R_08625 [Candidatus Latescibacterota bacterium]
MAHFFRLMGRFAGRAIRSHAFDRAVTAAAGYVLSEMKLTDLKAKRMLLKHKYATHLRLLGKTVYHLYINDIEPLGEDHIRKICGVLGEIEQEIAGIEKEIIKRQESIKKRTTQNTEHSPKESAKESKSN